MRPTDSSLVGAAGIAVVTPSRRPRPPTCQEELERSSCQSHPRCSPFQGRRCGHVRSAVARIFGSAVTSTQSLWSAGNVRRSAPPRRRLLKPPIDGTSGLIPTFLQRKCGKRAHPTLVATAVLSFSVVGIRLLAKGRTLGIALFASLQPWKHYQAPKTLMTRRMTPE